MANKYDYSLLESVEELQDNFPILLEKNDEVAKKRLEKSKDNPDDEPAEDPTESKIAYADPKSKPSCIFEHIIVFTNSKEADKNKTLKNILDAIKNLPKDQQPELSLFIAEDATYEELEDGKIRIFDEDDELLIDDSFSNVNTLVVSRLGVQGEEDCEHIVNMLQDRGFLVLNPIKYSHLASDKYETAVLLEKGEIPQPKFCFMDKDTLYDEEKFKEAITRVYPKWNFKDPDKNEDFKLVVKILDGHGGTGVALIDGKKLTAWLQLVFAIKPEQQLIIQKKEEADGGDIRVHVLTLRNKQVILGAMKRVKLGGDFRSNVSLGATAEPVKLTAEQEEIAVKTARLSKLPWCAVDIMPLVKGSNPELGDNAVLEINASPGTDGISDVLKTNFVNILLNELDNPTEFVLQDKIAGYIERVEIDFGEGPISMLAKLDTGNGTAASHVEVGEYTEKDGRIEFSLGGKKYSLEKIGDSTAKVGDVEHKRPVVNVKKIRLGKREEINIPIAVVKNRNKSTNVLLNRDLLSYLGMVIDPSQIHLLTNKMEKVKII